MHKRRLAAGGRRRVFALNFKGDVMASGVKALRGEVSLALANAAGGDEVVVRIQSSGGAPSGHGLAAPQLARIRARNIRLTAAIDIGRVSTGEFRSARDAVGLGLVDDIRTSGDYLFEAGRDADIHQVTYAEPRRLRRSARKLAELALNRASLCFGP